MHRGIRSDRWRCRRHSGCSDTIALTKRPMTRRAVAGVDGLAFYEIHSAGGEIQRAFAAKDVSEACVEREELVFGAVRGNAGNERIQDHARFVSARAGEA